MKPTEGIANNDSDIRKMFQDILVNNWKNETSTLELWRSCRLEIFESIEPKEEKRQNNFEYWKTGFFHICVTDPNIEELTKRIVENGGKQRSRIWELTPGKPFKVVSCEDPFGNVIDIYTHGYEYIWRSEAKINDIYWSNFVALWKNIFTNEQGLYFLMWIKLKKKTYQ